MIPLSFPLRLRTLLIEPLETAALRSGLSMRGFIAVVVGRDRESDIADRAQRNWHEGNDQGKTGTLLIEDPSTPHLGCTAL